jgi:hypothetical protein
MSEKLTLTELKCSNCGAEVQFLPGLVLSVCGYCGSKFSTGAVKTEVSVDAPDLIAPFLVTRDRFLAAIRSWLSAGDYTPDDVLTADIETKGTYLPFYAWSGEYRADWSASSGYDRQEEYMEMSGDKLVKKRRTVTDWRPSNGVVNGKYLVYTLASDALDGALTSFCEEKPPSSAVSFDPKQITGFTLEPFEKDKTEFQSRLENDVDAIAESKAAPLVPGDRKKDLNCTTKIVSQNCNRIYLPFWVTTFVYSGKPFRCIVDGVEAGRIIGQRPEDPDRIKKAKKLLLPGKLALIAVGIALVVPPILGMHFLVGIHKWLVFGLFGAWVILAIGGAIAKSVMLSKSKKLRQTLLAQFSM